jgi:acyl carrier protein
MQNEILEIVSQVMNVPKEQLNDESSPNTIKNWDSLKHMNLILALEEKYAVSFSDDEIVSMLSVKGILELLSKKQPRGSAMP